MADIYVVYAQPDRDAARRLVEALAKQWSVWWDEDLVGRYPEVVERELQSARCVVPLFSETSRSSDMVLDELRLAKKHSTPIIPARLDASDPPYGFGSFSNVDLAGWAGEAEHRGWRQLQHKISQVVAPHAQPRRPVGILSDRLLLPAVFTSVSSHETQLAPEDALALLTAFQSQAVLVSAYDWAPGRVTDARLKSVRALKDSGALILVDSGNYEASRLRDKTWTPELFAKALASIPHDLACSFDVMNPSLACKESLDEILAAVARDSTFTQAPIIPIVHAPALESGGHLLETLPQLLVAIASVLQPPMIAIPERELGPGLIARAKTMRRIRAALDGLPFYQPVHVLGTGNPWSIAVLAAAGADSFDGLEWCRVVVDRQAHRLNHFQHFDFFAHQARLAASPVASAAADSENVHFAGRAGLHNLDYYADLAARLQTYALKGGIETVVTTLLGEANTRQLEHQVPGLFR